MKVEYKQIARITGFQFLEDFSSQEIDKYWHLLDSTGEGIRTLCEGLALDDGSVYFEHKMGPISCPKCIERIKFYKSIKL